MTRLLELDIETRSAVNLIQTGVYVYAEHESTQITHVAWCPPGRPVECWLPRMPVDFRHVGRTITGVPVKIYGGPMPFGLWEAAHDPEVMFVAHNAGFERTVLGGHAGEAIGFPPVPLERWICTAATAAAMCLPRSLEGATAACSVKASKDAAGHTLMLKMCKPANPLRLPGEPIQWHESPADMIREAEYCAHDVYGEAGLLAALPPLSAFERDVWLLTERMNDHGVRVDVSLCKQLSLMIDSAMAGINARIVTATGGAVPKVTNHAAITRWLQSVAADDTGLGDDGIGKAALAAMLERPDLSDVVRDVLTLRRDGGKSSAAKYRSIMARVSRDGRIRGVLMYCGAEATGRWSSKGAQLHNLPRMFLLRKAASVRAFIRDLQDGATLFELEQIHGPPLVVASEMLRPVFVADDDAWMVRGDSSQIEARSIAWLGGAEWKLDAFRAYDAGTGPDVYRVGAAGVYRVPVVEISADDPRRQVGKVSELALGFQGGAGALQAMCRGYGTKIPRAERPADAPWDWEAPTGTDEWIKQQWRASNPELADRDMGLWASMDKAALDCMESAPGGQFHVGQLGIRFARSRRCLSMRVPSGAWLRYWNPVAKLKRMPWGKDKLTITCKVVDLETKQRRSADMYGGKFAQNATQRHARDLMAYWLLGYVRAGLTPVLTVHDEGIATAPRRLFPGAGDAVAAVLRVMGEVPDWSVGLPVAAEASAGPRYMKG